MSERLLLSSPSESKSIVPSTIRIENLLQNYEASPPKIYESRILPIRDLPEGFTVYNPAEGSSMLLGRVEHKDDENSQVWAFHNDGDGWKPNGLRIPNAQDPHLKTVMIDGKPFYLFDGVRVGKHPKYESLGNVYYTAYWCVKNIEDIPTTEPFAYTPPFYKDTPVVQYEEDAWGVFPRPQGEKGGRGVVCYKEFKRLDELSTAIEEAVRIRDLQHLFDKETVWGGFKDAFPLRKEGLVGLGGHVSYYTDESGNIVRQGSLRVYNVASAVYNRLTGRIEEMWIELTTEDLPDCESKILPNFHPDNLRRVAFGTVWDRLGNGRERILGGLRDRHVFEVVKEDRFERWERAA